MEKVGEDQLRLVDSIHALLSEAEAERRRAKEALVASRAEVAALTKERAALRESLAELRTRVRGRGRGRVPAGSGGR